MARFLPPSQQRRPAEHHFTAGETYRPNGLVPSASAITLHPVKYSPQAPAISAEAHRFKPPYLPRATCAHRVIPRTDFKEVWK
jgi:hypothetical protein